MAIRAVITIIKVNASVTYTLGNAADIWTDADSKNRFFIEEVPLADVLIKIVTKAVSDAVTLPDVPALHPLKSRSDSFAISDTYIKVLTKYLVDGFALDDGALIDKDFVGTKGNVAAMLDIMGLSYEHPVADSYTMSDILHQAWGYVRHFNDSIALSDSENNPLGTLILNTSILNATNSQFALTKGNDQVDVLGISDTTALTPGKNFTDPFTFSDIDSYNLGKGVSDTIGCTDVLYMDLKTFADSLSLSGTLVNHFYKNSSDTVDLTTVSDTINLSHVTGGVFNAVGVPLNIMTLN
jgi:hypothetical protein